MSERALRRTTFSGRLLRFKEEEEEIDRKTAIVKVYQNVLLVLIEICTAGRNLHGIGYCYCARYQLFIVSLVFWVRLL